MVVLYIYIYLYIYISICYSYAIVNQASTRLEAPSNTKAMHQQFIQSDCCFRCVWRYTLGQVWTSDFYTVSSIQGLWDAHFQQSLTNLESTPNWCAVFSKLHRWPWQIQSQKGEMGSLGVYFKIFQVEVEADLTSNRCDWNLELGRPIFTRLLFLTFWGPKRAGRKTLRWKWMLSPPQGKKPLHSNPSPGESCDQIRSMMLNGKIHAAGNFASWTSWPNEPF